MIETKEKTRTHTEIITLIGHEQINLNIPYSKLMHKK